MLAYRFLVLVVFLIYIYLFPWHELRKELGKDEYLPTVLLMGGREGIGPIEATTRALGNAVYDANLGEPTCRLLVICGHNKNLAGKLSPIDQKILYRYTRLYDGPLGSFVSIANERASHKS